MEIKLSDHAPVQLNYYSVPRLLYAELKAHIEDLFKKGCTVHLTSSNSSPVVSVKKKDGPLRLCCKYPNGTAKPYLIDILSLRFKLFWKN